MKNRKINYKKDYGIPIINILPAIVWSIPLAQFISPRIGDGFAICMCLIFVIVYYILSIKPVVAVIPCLFSVIMLTGLMWVFADWILDDAIRIIAKVVILGMVIFVEFGIFSNATVPWLQDKYNC